MMSLQGPELHIVCFDVPYPADYGGAIDVFYKIKALWEQGCVIYLHCFQYGRPEAPELKNYCKEVWYYKRQTGWKGLSLLKPYIVYSRRDKLLRQRLTEIEAPILFEGIHSTFLLEEPSIQNRLKIIRTHNIEAAYYRKLASRASSKLSAIYFQVEGQLLHRYEKRLHEADLFLELSTADKDYFSAAYPERDHLFLPPFHPFTTSDIPVGSGNYCLYHGNLSHPENEEAVLYLLKEVVPFVAVPFIIAGKDPGALITDRVKEIKHCTLVADPSSDVMERLIRDAHIHVLPTFQATGMKLKLLFALLNGRHVVCNRDMLWGSGLESICNLAESSSDFIAAIAKLMEEPFTTEAKATRTKLLDNGYANASNATRLITYLQQRSL
ncbi:MAG: mannosyltransferase [Sphingobacteriales bacterium]|nr:MAG: mannosyltransferase [Sphingobacteriales bacterium]